jgi:hypothetical protein
MGCPCAPPSRKVAAERAAAARLEADATAKARVLARALAEHDVPLRDVGTILGVSHQGTHQLINAGLPPRSTNPSPPLHEWKRRGRVCCRRAVLCARAAAASANAGEVDMPAGAALGWG